jgi:hypothetical protein
MRTLLILSLCLLPAAAFAQYEAPPPPDDAQDVEAARPPDGEPDAQPPAPPAAPPARAQNDDDQVGIAQQPWNENVGILRGSQDAYATQQPAPAPRATGQWVFTAQYGWVWMPYGNQYVDEGSYGGGSPCAYVYTVNVGWSWVAAPWLWGWGPYPYFGLRGPRYYGWYRGLYRSGYGWGHYRGGHARGSVASRSYPHSYSRGGAFRVTRPTGGGFANRGVSRPSGGYRATARPSGGSYRPSGGTARASGGGHAGGGFHASGGARASGGGFRGGGGGRR